MTAISITGAGGCIQNEIYLIADALRKAGYSVQIEDQWFPNEKYDDPEEIERIRKHTISFNNGSLFEGEEYKCPQMSVHIKATHIPWGG